MFDFEKFPVYLKTQELYQLFSKYIFNTKRVVPNYKDQLRRACSSILLNIAEGAGRRTWKEKRNFYIMARASSQECVAIIEILLLENCIDRKVHKIAHDQLTEIAKMLSGLVRTMNQKMRGNCKM